MPDRLAELSEEISALSERLAPHVVAVQSGPATFSGFVWRDDLVVTAEEALESEDGLAVTLPDGTRAAATLIGRDPSTDVALLRLDHMVPRVAAPLDGQTARRIGEIALALGRGDDGPVAALGVVSVVGPAWRSLRGGTIDARLLLDLRLPLALEGGLAVDANGKVFGMTVFGPRRSTLVIPAATIERVAAHLLRHGRVARGYLGLGLQPVWLDGSGEEGVLVSSVASDGPGREAGVLQGDIVARFAGERVGGMRALMARLGPESVGQTVELGLLRAGQPRDVTITIGERPAT
ncbi:MAG TPA: S1C family serine protease [Rubellimicrobium sp.]|jgi:S1-C subfamily serine protease|nr:S1C family serine protease [Rubellimicrobium sp.]